MESHLTRNSFDLDIETLLHNARDTEHAQSVHSVLRPRFQELSDGFGNGPSALTEKEADGDHFFLGDASSKRESSGLNSVLISSEVVVKGTDIGDLPTQYTIRDLQKHELPVIGTYVDAKILPGFTYTVRLLGSEKQQFSGRPMTLQRIGQGYGKRITFVSETKNVNNNYFYSDTRPEGYGFSVVTIQAGDSFTVLDPEDRPIGAGTIEGAKQAQTEIKTQLRKSGDIVKKVAVNFTCNVRYGSWKGSFPLCREHTLELSGIAIVCRKKGSNMATTRELVQLELPLLGSCTFKMEQ